MILSIRSMVITALMLVVISGCSGHGAPFAPNITDETGTVQELTDIVRDSAVSQNNHYCLLYNLINIDATDPDDVKMEVIPVRLGEIHLNILKLLEVGPCTDCFKLVGFNLVEPGVLDVDIEITHPFDNLDFSVFDVRGIMMFNGSHLFPVSGKSISDPVLGDGALLNAEGYTALYNGSTFGQAGDLMTYFPGKLSTQTIPNADINGYIHHNTNNPTNNRNAFFAGDSVTQTYRLKMPTTTFVLGYAVDANWWTPIETPVDDPITDFDLDANCPEPWKIEIDENPIDQGLTDQGGQTVLTLDVYDHESKDTHTAPILECTEIFDGSVTADFLEDGAGYSRWNVTISNVLLAPEGDYSCLVSVEANENVSSPEYLELIAYQIYTLEVGEYVGPYYDPVAIGAADPVEQLVYEPVHFYDDGSYDPDGGSIVSWEWDWDNDGTPDEAGVDAYHSWDNPGTKYVQFYVMDDEGDTGELENPLEIVIGYPCPDPIEEIEPNDSYDESTELPISCEGLGWVDLAVDPMDWWRFDVASDGVLDVTVETVSSDNPDENGMVNLYYWDGVDINWVDLDYVSGIVGTSEVLSVRGGVGTYYLHIFSSFVDNWSYMVSATHTAGDPADFYTEPNDTYEEAADLPLDVPRTGWVNENAIPTREDYWRIDIASDGVLEVTVETISSDSPGSYGAVYLSYWDGAMCQVYDSGGVSGVTGSSSVFSLRGGVGTYYLQFVSNGVENWYYTVSATHTDGDPADFYTEPNWDHWQAASLPLNTPTTGWVNEPGTLLARQDSWRIDVESVGLLEVTIETISSDITINNDGEVWLFYWDVNLQSKDYGSVSGIPGSSLVLSCDAVVGTYILRCAASDLHDWYYQLTATVE